MGFEELVLAERARQNEKWGEQNHQLAVWLPILVEEVGELASAILYRWEGKESKQKPKELENELVQVAAVCKVMWECGKRNGWL